MKKIVPTGEYVLLSEVIPEQEEGTVLLAESARWDKEYVVLEFGNEVDTEIEKGDKVFVQVRDLIKINVDEKTKLYMVKYKSIMGYEEE